VFDGDSDAVDFAAMGTPSFLDGVREVIGAERPAAMHSEPPARDANVALLEANVRMLEALAALDADVTWPAPLRDRAATAARKLLEQLNGE